MNWGGMPIGFRFYVEDYSRETKERCWAHVLRALEYADLTEVSLHEGETEEAFLPGQKVYIPVVGAKSIKVSRKNTMLWREDPALMGQLALYRPLIQENYMELFAPTRRLADVTMSGEIRPEAPGEGLLPKAIRRRESKKRLGVCWCGERPLLLWQPAWRPWPGKNRLWAAGGMCCKKDLMPCSMQQLFEEDNYSVKRSQTALTEKPNAYLVFCQEVCFCATALPVRETIFLSAVNME